MDIFRVIVFPCNMVGDNEMLALVGGTVKADFAGFVVCSVGHVAAYETAEEGVFGLCSPLGAETDFLGRLFGGEVHVGLGPGGDIVAETVN
jgi:hypothetical protein